MKPEPQFMTPRQDVIYQITERMFRETGTNRRTFAMVLADNYLNMVAEDDQDVPFRITRGGDVGADKKHNGQIIGRYLDGVVKKLPADLEDAWVLSLPQPYRYNCERELALRRGMLVVPRPTGKGVSVSSVATLMTKYAGLLETLAPAMEDGKFGPEDLPYQREINAAGDDVISAVLAVRFGLDRGIHNGGAGA